MANPTSSHLSSGSIRKRQIIHVLTTCILQDAIHQVGVVLLTLILHEERRLFKLNEHNLKAVQAQDRCVRDLSQSTQGCARAKSDTSRQVLPKPKGPVTPFGFHSWFNKGTQYTNVINPYRMLPQ
ncbi:hypothetical protein CAPTEDRAFT_193889 [Capitella teleta]|uniref:Uncharacterized protein n=1 Tax=Capitella teleta TaxID=283909 RepID=R7UY24_CAPTE|nr:hypothetical protein CAPTEDRAFT_193889 [Capitella teleta]|eukprot:ELU11483.1 hypothetical protein CAPTEDRAFT_193889 [Capitella teleta]